MRKKIGKVKELNPQKYYACCAVKLTAKNKQEIYELFSEYMEAYMTEWHNVREAREAIAAYVFKYNFERCHSSSPCGGKGLPYGPDTQDCIFPSASVFS